MANLSHILVFMDFIAYFIIVCSLSSDQGFLRVQRKSMWVISRCIYGLQHSPGATALVALRCWN